MEAPAIPLLRLLASGDQNIVSQSVDIGFGTVQQQERGNPQIDAVSSQSRHCTLTSMNSAVVLVLDGVPAASISISSLTTRQVRACHK